MSAAIWNEPPEEDNEAHPGLGVTIHPDRLPARPAHALPPGTQGSGFMAMRVYGVTPSGTRYALPPDVEPVPGNCIVPGCDCGGVTK
jgi:hypothetical protein